MSTGPTIDTTHTPTQNRTTQKTTDRPTSADFSGQTHTEKSHRLLSAALSRREIYAKLDFDLLINVPEAHGDEADNACQRGNDEKQERFGVFGALSLLDQCSVVAAHFQTPAKDGGTKTGTNFGTDGTNTGNQTFVALAKLLFQIFHDVGCKGEDGCNVGCQRCAMECGRYKYENRIQLLGTNETDDAADHANNCKDQQNIALSVFGKHFGRKCHDDNSDKNGNDRNKRVHISIAEHIAGEVDCGREDTLILCGEKDRANRKSAQFFAQHIQGAESRILKHTGHIVNEEAPQTLAEQLNAFYERHP